MDREFHRLCLGLALLACLATNPGAASAQVGAPPPEPGESGATAAPADGKGAEGSPLIGEPKSPEELFEATLLMVGVARTDLAQLYLNKLVSQDLDDDTVLALRDKFGPAPFLRLTNVKELQTAARKLLDRTNAVVARRANDPQYAVELLHRLDSADAEQQAAAVVELRGLGVLAVPGLLRVLADPAQADHQPSAMTALVQVGDPAIPLLIGALQGPSDPTRANIITVLGHLRSPQAAPYLWHPAFAATEPLEVRVAARLALSRIFKVPESAVERIATDGTTSKLVKTATQHFRHEAAWNTDGAGRVTLWTWSPEQMTVIPVQHTPEEASDIVGLALARQALTLAPDVRKVQALYLALAITGDVRQLGLDAPVPTGPGTAHDLALSVGPTVMLDVLALSLSAQRPETSIAALKVLDQVGSRSHLAGTDGKRSPILAALDYPDPRVQFAAARTILQFDPQNDFRGATRVVEVLKRTATAGHRPHAVVGEVSSGRGALIGGFLRDLGYEPLVYVTGREAFRAAAERGDVELIILHPNMIRWALSETLANLRADSRTAGIPVLIHGPGDLEQRLQPQLRNYRQVAFVSMAEQIPDFERQVEPVLKRIKYPPMTDAQRVALRREAIGWLAHIAAGRRTRIFDLSSAESVLIDALTDVQVAGTALEALSEIPTAAVQQRIAELAFDGSVDAGLRRDAALRLAFHVQRFGLLLPREAIARAHEVWNDTAQPAELRTALGGVIGSLKPDDTLVGKRLQEFPAAQ